MTNYEKIKNASLKELSYLLTCPYRTEPDLCGDSDCIECTREWLEEEGYEKVEHSSLVETDTYRVDKK